MKKSCTIIISHYNSLSFLRTCVRQIRRYRNSKVKQHIIISDQSDDENHDIVVSEFGNSGDIKIIRTKGLYSGYGIDYIMRYVKIKTQYICQLHVDAFPIHKNWLYMSLNLMEENDFKFVGVLQFVSKPTDPIYYYKNSFFSMAQSFHVGRADVYKEMALEGGFTRFHGRVSVDVPMTWNNNDWAEWAKEDYSARGSDDDVLAFCWEDNHREDDKMGFGLTGKIGISGEESGYGSIIEDMVFHFGFCRESIGVMPQMGEKYRKWTERINNGFTDELIDEMLIAARSQPLNPTSGRSVWDGKLKKNFNSSEELNNRIEELKKK